MEAARKKFEQCVLLINKAKEAGEKVMKYNIATETKRGSHQYIGADDLTFAAEVTKLLEEAGYSVHTREERTQVYIPSYASDDDGYTSFITRLFLNCTW